MLIRIQPRPNVAHHAVFGSYPVLEGSGTCKKNPSHAENSKHLRAMHDVLRTNGFRSHGSTLHAERGTNRTFVNFAQVSDLTPELMMAILC